MSAMNIVVKRDRAFLQCDASTYDTETGQLRGFASKAIVIPHLRAAFTCRGVMDVVPWFAQAFMTQYSTYDHLLSASPEHIRAWYEEFRQRIPEDRINRDFEMVIVGWSDKRDRPEAYLLVSMDEHIVEPYVYEPLPSAAFGPDLPEASYERLKARGIDIEQHGFAKTLFDPIKHGIPIMEEQRQLKQDFAPGAMHIVGGFIMSMEITKDGVSQQIIHRWNDRIGFPITPDPLPPVEAKPLVPGFMSRQQRRAAEREARKRA